MPDQLCGGVFTAFNDITPVRTLKQRKRVEDLSINIYSSHRPHCLTCFKWPSQVTAILRHYMQKYSQFWGLLSRFCALNIVFVVHILFPSFSTLPPKGQSCHFISSSLNPVLDIPLTVNL